MASSTGALRALERNRFFYGKAMDVRQWRMEQGYGRDSRALLSRLGLGVGVLSGLDVLLSADGDIVKVRAGVAIDPLGRTVVVPHDVLLGPPQQPTDKRGAPDGDPVTEGAVTLQLCYHECLTEPTSALACGCETEERCEAGVVTERYRLRLVRGLPEALDPVACPVIFPADPPDGFDRRRAVFDTFSAAPVPPSVSDDELGCCVVLATFEFAPQRTPILDPFTHRRSVYSNQALLELILCLADRVDECCRTHGEPVVPPRVMRLWPGAGTVIADGPRDQLARWQKDPRLEIAFEREIPEAVLDRPEDWLRVWSFTRRGDEVIARRVTLSRETGGQPPVLLPVGSELVAMYLLDDQYRQEMRTARVLIQLRPDDPGTPVVVDASSPPVLLDGEYHGTTLAHPDLDFIWGGVDAAGTAVDPSWWDALLTTSPPLPSGDGTPAGNLDSAFTVSAPERPTDQPRLLAVWPPSAAFLHRRTDDERIRRWLVDFREDPHLELTFDATLEEAALGSLVVEDWLRLWWLQDRGEIFVPRRLPLAWAGPFSPSHLAIPGTTVAVRIENFPFDDLPHEEPTHFLWMLRGGAASVDADFLGLKLDGRVLDAPVLESLWGADGWAGGVLSGPSSEGASLFDGKPGGILSAFFDLAERG